MCGVIGVNLSDVSAEDIELVKNLFLESRIRGLHATGVTFLCCDKLTTIKDPIPADEFIKRYDIEDMLDGNNLTLIGHIRYSTSDLRHNQPFQGNDVAIAHNGVISQDPSIWEYETKTHNDSELILRCIEAGDDPLVVYKHRSMAVVKLTTDGTLTGFRNHERPLWIANRDNGVIFASTKNILNRAGIYTGIEPTEPLVEYSYNTYGGFYENKTHFDPSLVDLQC